MASNHYWMKMLRQFHKVFSDVKTNRLLFSGACFACGSALMYYTSQRRKIFTTHTNNVKLFTSKYLTAHAASPKNHETTADEQASVQNVNIRENRFLDFASVEIKGEYYMTPQDFLESVTEESPRPRIGRLRPSDDEVKSMLAKTPDRKRNSSRFFRSLHDKGLISYTEYLFLLCILTKPKAGFEVAFNMFDADGNRRVDRKEFMVLGEIFRKRTEIAYDQQSPKAGAVKREAAVSERIMAIQQSSNTPRDTTLLIHLFGMRGRNDLHYDDFYRFMDNLQTEVLEIEFLAYSHGLLTISEEDFARMLLKYTDVDDTEEYIETLRKRIPQEKGISFDEFRSFFQFLNNLEDFAIAMQMYTLSGRSIGQDEFKRAVKISTGHELSDHLVDTIFQLFDKDGDNRLSQVEFMGVMKERIQRGFKRHGCGRGYVGLSGFSRCISREIHLYMRDIAAYTRAHKTYL